MFMSMAVIKLTHYPFASRRLEQRQPLRHLRAVGLGAARLEHRQGGVLARLRRAEVLDRVAVAGR
ncbi:MAG: hypothetical protein OXG04_08995, partial [Acidobacteria bacterium]|nr:hypothetical protein [Acidobacteriota bacterium]